MVIVLSVLLRFTDSDYPFGIFKLILIRPTQLLDVHTKVVVLLSAEIGPIFISRVPWEVFYNLISYYHR